MKSIETTADSRQPGTDDDGQVTHWDSLAALLDQEVAIYSDLSALCARERDVLVNFSVEDLLENNSRKETILLKARLIEESRIKLTGRIAETFGISSGEVTLSTLIGHADGHYAGILRNLQETLRAQLEELDEMNENNKVLLDSSLLYVQKSIDFICRLVTPSSSYGTDGEPTGSRATGRVICRKG